MDLIQAVQQSNNFEQIIEVLDNYDVTLEDLTEELADQYNIYYDGGTNFYKDSEPDDDSYLGDGNLDNIDKTSKHDIVNFNDLKQMIISVLE